MYFFFFFFFFKRNWLGYLLGNSSCGGVGLIRDHNGDWIISFSRSLGFTNSFIVELWALEMDSAVEDFTNSVFGIAYFNEGK